MIPVHATFVHPGALEMVADILRSTFLSEGRVVKQFERSLMNEFGYRNCTALNSGTSALHLSLVLAGVGEGDEVILPAQTFVATGLVVVQQKAIPVFADIDYSTGNISTESIRKKITSRTKAIIPVHWGGYPCDMDEIAELANAQNISIIEDAAHALGAIYKGKPVGNLSDFTCFSFQAIKHLTTGDGGAIICSDESIAQQATIRRWFGIDRRQANPSILGERKYNISEMGFKYHLNDYSAALGLANLQGFSDRLKKRLQIANVYTTGLSGINGINLFKYKNDRKSAYWLFGFHVEKREEFIHAMSDRGIATSVVHQRIDRNSIFGGLCTDLINQSRFDDSQIHIPIHDNIDNEKAGYIVDAIRKGW